MDTVKITFNDGSVHEYPKGTSYYEISKDANIDNIVAFKIGNTVNTLDKVAKKDEKVNFINTNDIIGNKMYKSGLKFLLEVAIEELYPNLKICFEHSVPNGLLCEVLGDKMLIQDDIDKIKDKMEEIVGEKALFTRLNVPSNDAAKYFRETGDDEKADNIENNSDKFVTLYRLKGKINYFYSGMPYSTEALNKYEIVNLGNNRIILLYPTSGSNGRVPGYVHYDKIISSFYEGKRWLNGLDMRYISNLNKKISENKVRDFISSCEIYLNINISLVVKEIIDRKDVKFILIAGPSSSGKTTTTTIITSYFKALGYNPIQISLDDYFLDRDKTPLDENGDPNFECVEALNVERFNNDLKSLLNGEEIHLPKYNFITGKSENDINPVKMSDNTIFIIEGLHAINDRLTESVDSRFKYKIYLSPFIPINIDKHNYISTLDLRLIRRIVRDNRTRGYNVEDTINSWQSVRKGEEKYIFPFIHQANAIINTALAYELNVLKVYAEPLLLSVKPESKYYDEARRLIESMNHYWTIPSEYVSSYSVLREFIGGLNV